jgi:hypothetical protein
MKNIKNTEALIELTLNELVNIEGGIEPTVETSFFYDVAWYIGYDFKKKFYYGLVF